MKFRIGDKVTHVEFPAIQGRVVAAHSPLTGVPFILVRWNDPVGGDGGGMGLTTSRHIPSALRHVQSPR